MQNVDRLLAFRDVVQAGGFTAAADRRGVSHSTVSRQVRELERELGALLLNRTTRTQSLTSTGERVYRHALKVGRTLQELDNDLASVGVTQTARLRVAALAHLAEPLLFPAIAQLRARAPAISVELLLQDGTLDFHASRLDLALSVGLPGSQTLVARRLCRNPVCIVASPTLAAQIGRVDSIRDLVAHPVVAYRSPLVEVTRWPYREDDRVHQLEVQPAVTVSDGASLLLAARAGLGIAYVSRFAAIEDLATGRLVELVGTDQLPDYAPIYLARADLELVSPFVRALEEALLRVAAPFTAG